jgi:hypothetical protein
LAAEQECYALPDTNKMLQSHQFALRVIFLDRLGALIEHQLTTATSIHMQQARMMTSLNRVNMIPGI